MKTKKLNYKKKLMCFYSNADETQSALCFEEDGDTALDPVR